MERARAVDDAPAEYPPCLSACGGIMLQHSTSGLRRCTNCGNMVPTYEVVSRMYQDGEAA